MKKIQINTLKDLKILQERLAYGEDVAIDEASQITHTIELSGGRFDDYDLSYINADIAKIILSYQDSYNKIASILEKDYDIKSIDKNLLIKFRLEKGCLKINSDIAKEFLKVVKDMDSKDKKQVIIAIVLATLIGASFYRYISYLENNKKLEAESQNRQIIAAIAKNDGLQNAINKPKFIIAKSLQEGESATFNDEPETITKDDINKYEFKDIMDTATKEDITDEFFILGFEVTNDKKRKFKLKVDGKLIWVHADMISADDRIELAGAIERNIPIKLKIRVIKEYNRVKEIQILDILKDDK